MMYILYNASFPKILSDDAFVPGNSVLILITKLTSAYVSI